MVQLFPAGGKIPVQSFIGWNPLSPSQTVLNLVIAIRGLLPVCVPGPKAIHRRQLSFRPCRILFPEPTKQIAKAMRQIHRGKSPDEPFVGAKKLTAGRKIVVNDIKYLALDPIDQSGQDDGFSTIVDITQWKYVAAAHMKKETESAYSNPAVDSFVAWTIYPTGADNHTWHAAIPRIFKNKLVLANFCVAVSLTSSCRLWLNRAGLL